MNDEFEMIDPVHPEEAGIDKPMVSISEGLGVDQLELGERYLMARKKDIEAYVRLLDEIAEGKLTYGKDRLTELRSDREAVVEWYEGDLDI